MEREWVVRGDEHEHEHEHEDEDIDEDMVEYDHEEDSLDEQVPILILTHTPIRERITKTQNPSKAQARSPLVRLRHIKDSRWYRGTASRRCAVFLSRGER